MENVITLEGISKTYGKQIAVYNLHLEVGKGQVFGLLGPNGSGKTTTLGIILGVLLADSGSFKWFGEEAKPEHRKRIGAILENPLFYPYLSAEDNLKIVAKIKGIDYSNIDNVLTITGLFDRRKDKFKTFSYGMKQRLAIASAILSNPEILILDEPTNGLDPQGIADIRNLIIEIAKQGITIVFASHMLDEVQKVCTHVAILNKGNKIASGSVEEVLNEDTHLEVAANNMDQLKLALEKIEGVKTITKEDNIYLISVSNDISESYINQMLFDQHIILTHLTHRKKSLEKYFLDTVSNLKK